MEQEAEQMGLNGAVYGARVGIGGCHSVSNRYTDGSHQALIHDFFSPESLQFQCPMRVGVGLYTLESERRGSIRRALAYLGGFFWGVAGLCSSSCTTSPPKRIVEGWHIPLNPRWRHKPAPHEIEL